MGQWFWEGIGLYDGVWGFKIVLVLGALLFELRKVILLDKWVLVLDGYWLIRRVLVLVVSWFWTESWVGFNFVWALTG